MTKNQAANRFVWRGTLKETASMIDYKYYQRLLYHFSMSVKPVDNKKHELRMWTVCENRWYKDAEKNVWKNTPKKVVFNIDIENA